MGIGAAKTSNVLYKCLSRFCVAAIYFLFYLFYFFGGSRVKEITLRILVNEITKERDTEKS